jgi:hypothetical protein
MKIKVRTGEKTKDQRGFYYQPPFQKQNQDLPKDSSNITGSTLEVTGGTPSI